MTRVRLHKIDPYHDQRSGQFTTGPGGSSGDTPVGTVRDGRRLEWGPDGSKVWVRRGAGDKGGPKQSSGKALKSNVVFLKAAPQYNRISKAAKLDDLLSKGKEAVQPLLDALAKLKPAEQKAVARALVNAIKPHLASVSKAGFDPSEARDPAGKWTVGGVAGAAAGMAGRGALALGGLTLRTLQDAVSTFTLIPSSKSSVSGALKEWWGRATSRDMYTRDEARIEGMARVFGTIMLGIGVYAVAQYYIPLAADAIGMSVSRLIGHALNLGVT